MVSTIAEFRFEASKLLSTIANDFDRRERPSLLYHYTDDAGLYGILTTGTLRLTDIHYLNDPSELRHGVQPALDLVSAICAKESRLSDFPEHLRRCTLDELDKIASLFVCCFSDTCTDLGQWRAYGDNGRGFALGFDTKVLEQAFEAKTGGTFRRSSFPVEYSESKLRAAQTRIVTAVEQLLPIYSGNEDGSEIAISFRRELLVELASNVITVATLFKHDAYRNEREWRFLKTHEKGKIEALQHKLRPYMLIPLLDFNWLEASSPAALKEIWIGPASSLPRGKRFASDCLRAASFGHVDVEVSKIPYSG